MCDEQEQQGRPNQLFFRGNHLDWPSQPNRRPPGTPIWPNLARVIDLQEFMGRRPSHPQARRCGLLPVPTVRRKITWQVGPRRLPADGFASASPDSPDWALLGANFRRSWCDLEPRAWIGISCNGCRAMAQAKLTSSRRKAAVLGSACPAGRRRSVLSDGRDRCGTQTDGAAQPKYRSSQTRNFPRRGSDVRAL